MGLRARLDRRLDVLRLDVLRLDVRRLGLTRLGGSFVVLLAAVVVAACSGGPPQSSGGAGVAAESAGVISPAASETLPESWHLGRAATDSEISALDIDIMPDGRGLPPGSGDHAAGAPVFATTCAPCHGPAGEGTPIAAALVDPDAQTGFRRRTVGHFWPYSTTAFDYIRRAMPWDAPGTLTNDQVYAVVAWILAENGVIDRTAKMDARSLPAIAMPGRDRFVRDDRTGGPEVR